MLLKIFDFIQFYMSFCIVFSCTDQFLKYFLGYHHASYKPSCEMMFNRCSFRHLVLNFNAFVCDYIDGLVNLTVAKDKKNNFPDFTIKI